MKEFSKKNLYHYTSFESAVKIIASKKLLFSEINKVNDINESCGPNYIVKDLTDSIEADKIMKHFTQISFTSDTRLNKGFDIPAMWGHYGDRGHGACLVFDRKNILQEIGRRKLYSTSVHYVRRRLLNDIIYEKARFGTIENFILSSKDKLFFTKSRDWAYEQEYRIAIIDDNPEPFNISDSLIGIILFSVSHEQFLKSADYLALSSIDSNIKIYRYCPLFQSGGLFDTDNKCVFPKIVYDLTASRPTIINPVRKTTRFTHGSEKR